MAPLFLGLDIGTQGAKAVIYDAGSRQIVGRGAHSYGLTPTTVPGRAEQAPSVWLEGARSVVRQALATVGDASCVAALAVSGQQHGLVALDADGAVLRDCKLWCDTESAPEADELSKALNFTLVPSMTATKLLWLKRHEPDVWERTAAVLLPHDYVNAWLTGRRCMEAGDASGTGVFDAARRAWDLKTMALVDERVPSLFPELIGPNDVVGTLLPEIASELGLPAGAVVGPGSGDNAMSALGSGVSRDGEVVITLGTSGCVFAVSGAPILDPSGAVCPFCDATGKWLPLVCTLNCTRAPEEVRGAFGLERGAITALAAAEPAGCHGVTMLPYLVGERTPNWPGASGALLGLRPGLLRPGVVYRAALEGATLALRAGMQAMYDLGLRATEVRLVGGGSANPLWQQIVADVFQLPVTLPLEAESAAFGAALQAGAVHSGVPVADFVQQHQPPMAGAPVLPNAANKAAYEEALARHVALGKRLFA